MEFKVKDYKANEILKFIRQNTGLTQEEFSKLINKSKEWVKKNEQGKTNFYFKDLLYVAKVCNIDIIVKDK